MHHRLWRCCAPEAVAVRSSVAPPALVARARAEDADHPLYSEGWIPLDSEALGNPALDYDVQLHIADADGTLRKVDREPTPGMLCGAVCLDGSASQSPLAELRRASWAVVQVDDQGRPSAAVSGLVPCGFPQTSQAAEFLAAHGFSVYGAQGAQAIGDCSNVVKQVAANWPDATAPHRKYAGVVRSMWRCARGPWVFRKVAAHVTDAAAIAQLRGDELRDHFGNEVADELAKSARLRHPCEGGHANARRDAGDAVADAEAVCQLIAHMTLLWPPLRQPRDSRGGRGRRAGGAPLGRRQGPVAERVRQALRERGHGAREAEMKARVVAARADAETHEWDDSSGRDFRRCRVCQQGWFGRETIPPCAGASRRLAALVAGAKALGHSLAHCENPRGAKLVSCLTCGAWSEAGRGHGLRERCGPPTREGRRSMARLRRGRHPTGNSGAAHYGTCVARVCR